MWKFLFPTKTEKPTNAEIEDAEEKRVQLMYARQKAPTLYTTTNPTLIIDCLILGSELDACSAEVMQREIRMAKHEGVDCVKILVEDFIDRPQHEIFERTFALIDKAIAENKGILVHCARGRSRSATVVIGYLMTRKNISLKDAHGHVKKLRPIIGPHNGLQLQLIEFEKHLTGTSTMQVHDFYGGARHSPYG